MTYLEVFFSSALVAIEALAIALVLTAFLWDPPLEGLADPMHTPNPAKQCCIPGAIELRLLHAQLSNHAVVVVDGAQTWN